MSDKQGSEPIVITPWLRYVLGGVALSFIPLLPAAAASVPFVIESRSIRYKLGTEKALLRSGQVIGMMAAALFLPQLILGILALLALLFLFPSQRVTNGSMRLDRENCRSCSTAATGRQLLLSGVHLR